MKKLIIILVLSFVYQISNAQTNVAFWRGTSNNSCGYKTDDCYSYAHAVNGNLYTLNKDARSRLTCTSTTNVSGDISNVRYLVIVSCTFTYDGTNCRGTVYGFGGGSSRSDALNNAVSNLETNNWSWRKSYGYKIVEDKAL